MAYSHLSASKIPRVRHSIRNTMAREELDMAGMSEGGSASGSMPRNSVTSMTPPTIHLSTGHRERSVKKRISMAAVGHTALGSLLKRGHINSMRQKAQIMRIPEHTESPMMTRRKLSIFKEAKHEIPEVKTEEEGDQEKKSTEETENNQLQQAVSEEALNVEDSDLIFINCSGFQYVTTARTLSRFPESLLGDPDQREALFSKKLNAYYLDRHRACFESILQFYQTGIECPPPYIDLHVYHSEKEFYGLKRSRDTVIEIREHMMKNNSCLCCSQSRKLQIHKFLIGTPKSCCASFYQMVDIFMIGLATILFILESEDNLKDHFALNHLNDPSQLNLWMFILNSITILWFTGDIILRLITWPKFLDYWRDYMNILDIVSVLPFYIEMIQWGNHTAGDSYDFLRALRLIRVVRVFKFVRHSESIMVILKAVVKARNELLVLFVSIFLFVITFGSIMFYLEHPSKFDPDVHGSGPNTHFSSILMSCWWVLVSVTTVGFGDMYPVTTAGKFAGSVVLCLGIICLALPMTIIVTKFSIEFDREKS